MPTRRDDYGHGGFPRSIDSQPRRRSRTGSVTGWVWRTVVNAARTTRRDLSPVHLPLDGLGDISSQGRPGTVWQCPDHTFCGELVSVAWAPDGRRLADTGCT